MRATIMYGAGDVRVENVPDPSIVDPADAIIRVVRACICGSDLWPYNDMPKSDTGQSMGHEAIGVVEAVGKDVRTISSSWDAIGIGSILRARSAPRTSSANAGARRSSTCGSSRRDRAR